MPKKMCVGLLKRSNNIKSNKICEIFTILLLYFANPFKIHLLEGSVYSADTQEDHSLSGADLQHVCQNEGRGQHFATIWNGLKMAGFKSPGLDISQNIEPGWRTSRPGSRVPWPIPSTASGAWQPVTLRRYMPVWQQSQSRYSYSKPLSQTKLIPKYY